MQERQGEKEINFLIEIGIMEKNVADPLEMDKTVSLESCCKYFTKFSTCNNISSELSMYGELGKRIKIKGSVIYPEYIGFVLKLVNDDSEIGKQESVLHYPESELQEDHVARWLCKICKKVYCVEINVEGSEALATRKWLAIQMYYCIVKIADKILDNVGEDWETNLFLSWLNLRDRDSDFFPNYKILGAKMDIQSDGYRFMSNVSKVTDVVLQKITLESMIEISKTSTEFKKSILRKNNKLPRQAYHYTSLISLKKILLSSEKIYDDLYITLHESNVEYLNDPDEGMLFVNGIQTLRGDIFHADKKVVMPRSEYITSLIAEEDEHLSMWVQYGDGGEGCRIEFEIPERQQGEVIDGHDFFEVRYRKEIIEEESPFSPEFEMTSLFSKCIADFENKVKNSKQEIGEDTEEEEEMCYQIIADWVYHLAKGLGYYYKDIYYEHEHEIRIISRPHIRKNMIHVEQRENEVFGRMYMKCPIPLKVNAIRLGPKCDRKEEIALWLTYQGINRVEKSEIKYR